MISLNSLYESIKETYKIKLISGEKGISNAVSWTYFTEDFSSIDFIRGGELTITTGMYFANFEETDDKSNFKYIEENLIDFISRLKKLNAAGLIINTGKYILEIPEKVIEYSNKIDFPLFTMPWEIHIVDIMQNVGNKIVRDNQKTLSISENFEKILFSKEKIDYEILKSTQFANLSENEEYLLCAVELSKNFLCESSEFQNQYIKFKINSKLEIPFSNFCCLFHDDKLIYVFKGNFTSIKKEISKSFKIIFSSDKFFTESRVAFSSYCKNFLSLKEEYEHALTALKLFSNEIICDYENLGVYKLFSEIKNKQILESFCNEILGKLDILGNEKKKDYLNTLKLYLESSGKVQKTAEENFTHRNTVNYRIRKIVDILGVDLNDGKTRYLIQTALYLKEMLALM